MKKFLLAIIFTIFILYFVTSSLGVTSYFTKIFSKTLYPDDVVEQNFTIKKFYNLTIKFQKYNSTSYITIRNSNTTIILKDANGNDLITLVSMNGNTVSTIMDKLLLNKVKTVSAFNLNNSANTYEDVIDQAVNVSFIRTNAKIIVKVNLIVYGTATVTGFVTDELTNQTLAEIVVAAYDAGADLNTTVVKQNTTDVEGKYVLVLPTNSLGKSFDFYVKDYEVSAV